jgi:hypothetical protein
LLSLASVEDEATPPVYVFGVDLDSGEEIVFFCMLHTLVMG